jgi:5'-3' exonuclease
MIKGEVKKTIQEEIVIRTVKNCPSSYDDIKRVLLVDFDSVLYFATYFPEDSIMTFPDEESQIEEAKFRVRNKLQEIQNNIEEYYNITHTMIFIGGKNNFRYKIFPEYKINRANKEKSPLLPIIKEYIIKELEAIESHGAEADDYVIECMKECKGECIIACIDKDIMYYAPDIPIYDYRSYNDTLGEFKLLSNVESRLAIASQIIIGDATDGVPGAFGLGKAYCSKNLHKKKQNLVKLFDVKQVCKLGWKTTIYHDVPSLGKEVIITKVEIYRCYSGFADLNV